MSDVIVDHEVGSFPFSKSDIKYWVLKRKDGVVAKFVLTDPLKAPGIPQLPAVKAESYYGGYSLRDYCDHAPNPGKDDPIVDEKGRRIFIADAPGLRKEKYGFDFILDNGDVLTPGVSIKTTLSGSEWLCEDLREFGTMTDPILLKVDWPDRQDPPLAFGFWKAYLDRIEGNIVTACQGGHGRSGTSLVCLMMELIPDYTPYAAICHLRALHCARAIESKVQHEYIGKFGAYLGRKNDVELVEDVKDFKEAFLKLELDGAKKYQEQLRKKGGK